MGELITMEKVQADRLRRAGHSDGKGWFAEFWQHTTLSRLTACDRTPRRGGAPKSPPMGLLWQADGTDCASLEEVIEQLNVPPVVTKAERAFLERVPGV